MVSGLSLCKTSSNAERHEFTADIEAMGQGGPLGVKGGQRGLRVPC